MASPEPIIHIVDDDQAVRTALQWMLRAAGMRSQAHPSAQAFLRDLPMAPGPGCILLDIRMPGMSGLELQEELRAQRVQLPIIIITGHGDVPTAVHAMRHGAVDFLQKPLDPRAVLARIRDLLQRQATAAPTTSARQAAARFATLTPREREVMELIVAGRLNKQVAAALGLSRRTVEKHRAQIMAKMHAGTPAELVHLAYQLRQEPPQAGAARL